ncbi:MAG: cytochrome c3 family protein [Thermodesulfovibrionales bacterium]|nr:cytochrome c3 family protein [Thermodesulfovibrionales bacterium]
MKFKHLIGLTALIIVCVLTLLSGISHSGVLGSLHDLTVSSSNKFFAFDIDDPILINEQICVFCHTPHGAKPSNPNKTVTIMRVWNGTTHVYEQKISKPQMLLWNRNLPTLPASGPSYLSYTSSTMDTSTTNMGTIRIYSLLCLSCHDGVGAMNVLFNYPMGTTQPLLATSYNTFGEVFNATLGTDVGGINPNIGDRINTNNPMNLSNDHPVSFDFVSTHPDVGGGLRTPSLGYVQNAAVRLFFSPGTDKDTSMECSTCHNVHDQGGEMGSDNYPFLVMSKVGSALCTNCHNK